MGCQTVIEEAAPAKINLFLHVLGRRKDGLHLIESLAAFSNIADRLTLAPAARFSLEITGPFAASLEGSHDNLVIQAAHALVDGVSHIEPGAKIVLEKNLPVAAGIGSGSADAAACLRGLLRLADKQVSQAALVQLAAGLGSDVPVCLASKAAVLSGTGVQVTTAPALPRADVVLVNPNVRLDTAEVYAALSLAPDTLLANEAKPLPKRRFRTLPALVDFLGRTRNDLEAPAARLVPDVPDVIEALFVQPGCLLARMSGSGPTCFGLFDTTAAADAAAHAIKAGNKGWWTASGRLS